MAWLLQIKHLYQNYIIIDKKNSFLGRCKFIDCSIVRMSITPSMVTISQQLWPMMHKYITCMRYDTYPIQSFDYSKNLYDIVQDTYLDMNKNS